MDTLMVLLLGIVQGLTEFLPVSSSGHLILAQTFLGINAEPEGGSAMLVEVALHLATGIAVLYVFRRDIANIIRGCFSSEPAIRKDNLTYSGWVILATIPAAIVGIFFKDKIEVLFDTSSGNTAAYIASFMLFVTAALLFFSSMKKNDAADGKLTCLKAIAIGLMQAVAITPGISRSGSTIAVALLLGVSRAESGRFSFMLALPAIFGAALLEARHIDSVESVFTLGLLAGFIASLAVGIAALKLLLTFIKKGKLHYFGYYCASAAVVSIVLLTLGAGVKP
jgi:undecaprenyl-diphosphatase